jgi:hypothetical protein
MELGETVYAPNRISQYAWCRDALCTHVRRPCIHQRQLVFSVLLFAQRLGSDLGAKPRCDSWGRHGGRTHDADYIVQHRSAFMSEGC